MDSHISQGHWQGSGGGRVAREVATVWADCLVVSRHHEEFDDSEDFWFQQDGATAHTARHSLRNFERNVPKSTHPLTRRYWVARVLARFDPLRFFPVGIPQGRSL